MVHKVQRVALHQKPKHECIGLGIIGGNISGWVLIGKRHSSAHPKAKDSFDLRRYAIYLIVEKYPSVFSYLYFRAGLQGEHVLDGAVQVAGFL